MSLKSSPGFCIGSAVACSPKNAENASARFYVVRASLSVRGKRSNRS